MTVQTVSNTPLRQCHARRHMTASVFMTYDAILAMAKSSPSYDPSDPLFFYGKVSTVANHNNRSRDIEHANIKILVTGGWLYPDEDQSRWKAGQWGTRRYQVIEHDCYAKEQSCPPLRYDPKTGNRIGERGSLGRGLMERNRRRRLLKTQADLGSVASGRTVTEDSDTVAVNGDGRFCHGQGSPQQEVLSRTVTEGSVISL